MSRKSAPNAGPAVNQPAVIRPARAQPANAIAIVGVSALFPGSSDASGFWRDILAGRDLLNDVPPGHWRIEDYFDPDPSAPDKTYAKRGGFLNPVDFDALDWGVPPSTLSATDTSQLLALIVAKSVLQDAAREQFEHMDRSRISVILGVTSAQELLFSMVSRLQRPVWVKAMRETGLGEDEVQAACERIAAHYVPWQEASFPGLLGNVVAGRIANRLNLGGTNCVTDAACASSFSAISMAVSELQLGHSDLVIAGGVDTLNDIFMYMCFSKTPALSPSGDCRPFSDQADGTMLGEGLGMVALKRLADAEAAGDRIYAVLRGVGTSSDGRSKSVYAPVSAGQALALRRAYEQAGYGPETVELMEAHGTGTKAGDAAEFGGLEMVYGAADTQRKQWCALGSVKSQIGHTKAAAGAAGLFKAVMALHHKVLPPTIKIDAPNPLLNIANSPFYLNTQARPWIRDRAHPRRASVSAFGFGGSNFHLTLEEYLGPGKHAERLPVQAADLLLLCANSPAELISQVQALQQPGLSLAELAQRSRQQWRNNGSHRLALVSDSKEQLAQQLAVVLKRLEASPEQGFELPDGCSYGIGALQGKLALLFPGQGSQYLGMGADLAMQFDGARAVWDQAAELISDGDQHLHDRVFAIPTFDAQARQDAEQQLTATQWAQPALAAHSLSLLALLSEFGIAAEMVAGHSFGELTALHAAGAFDSAQALQLARARGMAMAAASEQAGAMTAISAPINHVRELIAEFGDRLVVANHNGPKQIVVSGEQVAIDSLESKLAAAKLGYRRLPVANAFHSKLVASASATFAGALNAATVSAPSKPVYANSSAASYPAQTDQLRAQLAQQLSQPVRFVEMVEMMYADGARVFVEVGPGSVLSGLVGAILGQRPHSVVVLDRKGRNGVSSLLAGLAKLAATGVAIDPRSLYADTRLPTPATAKMKMPVSISGSNYGKPYPPADGAALPKPNASRVAPQNSVPGVAQANAVSPPTPTSSPASTSTGQMPLSSAAPNSPATASSAASVQRDAPQPANPESARAPVISAPTSPAFASGQQHSMSNNSQISPAWLAAFQDSQQQTAAAHQAFQRAMSDSHTAYLQLAQSALQGLSAALAGSPELSAPVAGLGLSESAAQLVPALAPVVASSVQATAAAPAVAAIPAKRSTPLMSAVSLDAPRKPPTMSASPASASLSPLPSALSPASDPSPQPSALSPAPNPSPQPSALSPEPFDLPALLLSVVAEKTGYPLDMLNLDMDLEGDLGVDSIKRVEILATLDERAPHLPKVDRARLTALHTLAEIIAYLDAAGAATNSPAPAPLSPTPNPNPSPQPSALSPKNPAKRADSRALSAAPANNVDLPALLLSVVAEKTGYPLDMLNLDMDLEGDLGVDSIKRVEILATLDERAPHLPKVDRARLTALHTLAEIIAYLDAAGSKSGAAEPALLSFQPSVLSPDSDPSPQPSALSPAPNPSFQPSALSPKNQANRADSRALSAAPANNVDLPALLLSVVAEKTGYPPDMLNLDMDLEGDLGVDSIKRVEILATLDERAPHLPKVDRARLTALHTLAEIIANLDAAGSKTSTAGQTPLGPQPSALSPTPNPSPQPSALSPAPNPSPHPSALSPDSDPSPSNSNNLGRYVLAPIPAPASGLAMPGLLSAMPVWVIGEASMAEALATELELRGVLAYAGQSLPEQAQACIYVGALAPIGEQDNDAALTINQQAFAIARQLGKQLADKGGLLVTVQDSGGDFGLSGGAAEHAWRSGLPALIKTCALEWPKAAVKAIDIERAARSDAELAIALAEELLSGGGEIEVGLRANGERSSLCSVAQAVDPSTPVIGPGEVVVVSGGARGVTAGCLVEWARRCQASFVLLGRTELTAEPAAFASASSESELQARLLAAAKSTGEKLTPAALSARVRAVLAAREVRQTLDAIIATGTSAHYFAVSVEDEAALAAALARVRKEIGPIRALVHAAGVIADRRIVDKTDAQFAQVFNTKVLGLRALLAATVDDPLKLLCVFSSVSARCGNTGQADYAMANEVLNKVARAQQAQRPQLRVKALGWGPWEGGMVSPALRQRFAELGVPMIPLDHGARMFADEMADPSTAIELVLGGEPRPEALLSSGADVRVDALELRVQRISHDYLAGHAVNGEPVVPVVLVAEWLTRAARSFRPGLAVVALHDLRVLKGIRLPGFENGGDLLRIEASPLPQQQHNQLQMRVLDGRGQPRYSARVELRQVPANADQGLPELHLEDWSGEPLYQDLLFHRGSFELIDQVAGISDHGIRAQLRGVHSADWPADDWQLDVAALDGGMQMAVLYGQRMLGGPNLPTSIGQLRTFPGATQTGPITATAYSRQVGAQATTTDILFTDADGRRFAELLGVENHALPGA